MENKIIVANLKTYMNLSETNQYLNEINGKINNNNVIFAPTSLFSQKFISRNYSVALQNVSFKNDGNCTGEILASQAKSFGINYAIVGHAERTLDCKEYKTKINEKIINCLNNNIKVILCVGEFKKMKLNKIYKLINKRLNYYLKEINSNQMKNIIFAYEPYWAIGNEELPNVENIKNIINHIRKYIKQKYDVEIDTLYGGSVNSKNIQTLIQISNVSGFLVGESSTKSSEFLKIIEVAVNR